MKHTIGSLIDKLSIVNMKIFVLEDNKRNPTAPNDVLADATRKTNILNSERNALIDEIDIAMNEIAQGKQQKLYGSNKSYGRTGK